MNARKGISGAALNSKEFGGRGDTFFALII